MNLINWLRSPGRDRLKRRLPGSRVKLQRVPLHAGVAVGMIVFGGGILLNPAFPFQGDLHRWQPLAPVVYGLLFIASGLRLLHHRPRPLTYLGLTSLLFTHLMVNIVDILLTATDRFTPIIGLYGLLLFMLVKAYRAQEEVHG